MAWRSGIAAWSLDRTIRLLAVMAMVSRFWPAALMKLRSSGYRFAGEHTNQLTGAATIQSAFIDL